MSFNELVLTTEKRTNEFESLFNRCVLFAEASYNEYKINLKEAELKVIQESGTTEDLICLESEAKEGFIVKCGKTIEKMVNAFIDWISDIIKSIEDFFSNEKTKMALKKAEKAAKDNPNLKNTKVEVVDVSKVDGFFGKYEAKVEKMIAKFKAGKFSENDDKELDNIEEEFDKDKKSLTGLNIAVPFMSALAILGVYLNNIKKTKKDVESGKKINVKETDNPEDMEKHVNARALHLRIMKEKANFLQKAIKDVFKNIRGKVTGSGEIEPSLGQSKKDKDVTESASVQDKNEQIAYLNDLISEIEESAKETTEETDSYECVESTEESNEMDKYLEALEAEICSKKEDDSEYVTVESYLAEMEAELFSESKEEDETNGEEISYESYLEKLESEIFSESEKEGTSKEEEITYESYLKKLESEILN